MKTNLHHLRQEYREEPLSEEKINADPLVQFGQWFDEAVASGVTEPNAMVLSTAESNGRVSARVVLLKGIEPGGFTFFTNYFSLKARQLKENPMASLTFHWKEIQRQVRVEGRVKKVSRRESESYFYSRPLESQVSAVISPQSNPIPDRQFLVAMRDGLLLDLQGAAPGCPPDWGGYILNPQRIEFWQGRAYRLHDRLLYSKKRGHWIVERLAP